MVKKGIFLATAVAVLVGLVFGREGFSHVKTSLGWVRQSVRESVPVEFEISRARQMIKDLDPRHMGVCFDIGHATIEGGSSHPIEARLVQRHFTAVFVKDFLWERTDNGWRERWVPLGDGMVEKAFFKWLKTTSFTGPISQHHEYDHGEGRPMIAKMQKDLKVLREWLAA